MVSTKRLLFAVLMVLSVTINFFLAKYMYCSSLYDAKTMKTNSHHDNVVMYPDGRKCHMTDALVDTGSIKNLYSGFVFSAIAEPNKNWSGYDAILVNAWDSTSGGDVVKCCFLHRDLRIEVSRSTTKGERGHLKARQHRCTIKQKRRKYPMKVALIDRKKQKCSMYLDFTEIYYPVREPGTFAVCTKIAYGVLQPRQLVEWFEYQRMNGVDFVISLVNDLDKKSREVLEYYRKEGFVETRPFILPGTDNKTCNRRFQVGRREFPYFTQDEDVATLHCASRLIGYEYVAVIDFDEYIAVHENMTWKSYFNKTLQQSDTAGMTFHVEFFITDWGKMANHSSLTTQSYLNRTEALWECYKNVYMPSRVVTSSVSTHLYEPKPGYKKINAKIEESTLHHYRVCPVGGEQWRNCSTRPRYTDSFMNAFSDELELRVKTAVNDINSNICI